MSFYIKPNQTPPGEVAFWLHVDVGAADEETGEEGMAHFIEHMAFNGTKDFSARELDQTLRAMGLTTGQHQNAFTTFSQTTYQLNIPNADRGKIETALCYLSDVAFQMSLSPDEVEKEKQVICEEMRARSSGQQRLLRQLFASWFKNTPAGNHEIIGSEASVRSFTPEALAAFYQRNYRPEKTTLIIAGDVNAETVKRAIEARFSGWEREADAGSAKTQRTLPESDGTIEVMIDPDHKDTELIVATLSPSVATQTESDFRTCLVRTIVSCILEERFKTLLQDGAQPFYRAMALSSSMFHICHTDLLSLGGVQNRWQEIVAAAARELHRASIHGFLSAEIEQAKASVLAGIKETVAREQTRDTRQIVSQINEDVSTGSVPLSATEALALAQAMLPGIAREEIEVQFRSDFSSAKRMITLFLPDATNAVTPSDSDVRAAVAAAEKEPLEAWKEEPSVSGFLEKDPPKVELSEPEKDAELEVSTFRLANNLVVRHRQMRTHENEVLIRVTLGGGEIEETAANRGITQLVANALNQTATERLSSNQFRRLLNGRTISFSAVAEPDCLSLTIATSPQDAEEAFRLLHAVLTSARIESGAVEVWRESTLSELEEQRLDALVTGIWELDKNLYARDLRHCPLSPENVLRLDKDAAQHWLDRLLTKAPAEVAVVGDLDGNRTRELVSRYLATTCERPVLGSSPSEELRTIAVDGGPVVVRTEVDSVSNKAVLTLGHRGVPAGKDQDAIAMKLSAFILSERLRWSLREEKGFTYSIQVDSVQGDAYPEIGLFLIRLTCDPKKLDEISAACQEVISAYVSQGPSDAELASAKLQLLNQIDRDQQSPMYWLNKLARVEFNGSTMDSLKHQRTLVREFPGGENLQRLVEIYLAPERRIMVMTFPKATKHQPPTS